MPRLTALAALLVALAFAGSAAGSAPPVGPLPQGPMQTITTQRGSLVSIALPHRSGGLVWRLARTVSPKVLVEVGEADVGTNVVVVFRAKAAGRVLVRYGLTKGETKAARESRTFDVRVR